MNDDFDDMPPVIKPGQTFNPYDINSDDLTDKANEQKQNDSNSKDVKHYDSIKSFSNLDNDNTSSASLASLVKNADKGSVEAEMPSSSQSTQEFESQMSDTTSPDLQEVPDTNNSGRKNAEKMQKIDRKTGQKKFRKNGKPVYCWSLKKKLAVGIPSGVFALLIISICVFILIIQGNMRTSGMQGSFADVLTKKEPLQVDQYGRSNILIFGTSEDEEGHGGAMLADTIMVLSVNEKTGAANTISIPRDLWVQVDFGCLYGSQFKINATYPCGIDASNGNQPDGAMKFASTVGNVLGIDIQYYIKMDWGGVVDIVNAVGGIDVTPYTDSPNGIYDRITGINLPPGESHLDGDLALRLSRSRNSHGGYGLSRSNFDREINQQLILNAVRKKASSVGVLANPVRIAEIFSALGNHMLTNIKFSEVSSFANVAQAMKDAVSLPLTGKNSHGETVNYVITGTGPGGASIVQPSLGLYNYSAIQDYIKSAFTSASGDPSAKKGVDSQTSSDETAK